MQAVPNHWKKLNGVFKKITDKKAADNGSPEPSILAVDGFIYFRLSI